MQNNYTVRDPHRLLFDKFVSFSDGQSTHISKLKNVILILREASGFIDGWRSIMTVYLGDVRVRSRQDWFETLINLFPGLQPPLIILILFPVLTRKLDEHLDYINRKAEGCLACD